MTVSKSNFQHTLLSTPQKAIQMNDWSVLDKTPTPPPSPVTPLKTAQVAVDTVEVASNLEELCNNILDDVIVEDVDEDGNVLPAQPILPALSSKNRTISNASTSIASPNGKVSLLPETYTSSFNDSTNTNDSNHNENTTVSDDAFNQSVVFVSDIASLLSNPLFADVIFSIDGKEFKAHKNILAARSPVFKRMLQDDSKKKARIDLVNVDPVVFEALLNFIYTGDISPVERYASELLMLADKVCLWACASVLPSFTFF